MSDRDQLECRCGADMDVEVGLVVDVVRCPNCRREGARGPEHRLADRIGSWVREVIR